ncbi:hypothetical protein N9E35_01475 [Candidatus Marinimicrobia bacterium]|nr:hypothetical protein [Candidatus Neomarinimicrobiota bacterium]
MEPITEVEVLRPIKIIPHDLWYSLVDAFGYAGYWAHIEVSDYNGLRRVTDEEIRNYINENGGIEKFQTYSDVSKQNMPYKSSMTDSLVALNAMKGYVYMSQIPLLGGELTVYDSESGVWNEEIEDYERDKLGVINPQTIKEGVDTFAEEGRRHFDDFISQGGDAITSDVLLQYIVLGKITYG